VRRFAYEYGSNPLHLLVALTSLLVAAWALLQAIGELGATSRFLIWFVGAILVHDFLFVPLYSALGLVAGGALLGGERRSRLRVAALNHLRVPAILSGLALLVWFPLILSTDDAGFESATGLTTDVYLGRWLALTAALFAGSALLLALRARRLKGAG
jgi:hypothetical protein